MTANEKYRELIRQALIGLKLAEPVLEERFGRAITRNIKAWEQEALASLNLHDINERAYNDT